MMEANHPHVSTTCMETFLLKPHHADIYVTKCDSLRVHFVPLLLLLAASTLVTKDRRPPMLPLLLGSETAAACCMLPWHKTCRSNDTFSSACWSCAGVSNLASLPPDHPRVGDDRTPSPLSTSLGLAGSPPAEDTPESQMHFHHRNPLSRPFDVV